MNYPVAVHFQSKHYVHMTVPYERHQSDCCKLWHVPNNRQHQTSSSLYNVCQPCKSLSNRLDELEKRHKELSDSTREEWKQPSSKRPLKYCSPTTGIIILLIILIQLPKIVKDRHSGIRNERKAMAKRLKKYDQFEFSLNSDQHDEFVKTVTTVTEQCPDELSKVLEEADKHGKGDVIREVWKHDVEDRIAFKKDQTRNGKFIRVCVYLLIRRNIFLCSV